MKNSQGLTEAAALIIKNAAMILALAGVLPAATAEEAAVKVSVFVTAAVVAVSEGWALVTYVRGLMEREAAKEAAADHDKIIEAQRLALMTAETTYRTEAMRLNPASMVGPSSGGFLRKVPGSESAG